MPKKSSKKKAVEVTPGGEAKDVTAKTPRAPKITEWNLPYAGGPDGELNHKMRDTSLRGKFREACRGKGATLAALEKIVEAEDVEAGKEPKNLGARVHSVLKIMHEYNGVGFKQDGNRIIVIES